MTILNLLLLVVIKLDLLSYLFNNFLNIYQRSARMDGRFFHKQLYKNEDFHQCSLHLQSERVDVVEMVDVVKLDEKDY
jgi:hypothetical protein